MAIKWKIQLQPRKNNWIVVSLLTVCIHLLAGISKEGKAQPSIIPYPAKVTLGKTVLSLPAEIPVYYNSASFNATYLANELTKRYQSHCTTKEIAPNTNDLKSLSKQFAIILYKSKDFKVAASNLIIQKEAYDIRTTKKGIFIISKEDAGLFYGIQTLLQLISSESGAGDPRYPVALINDYPNYVWRGMHLDCSRHFFTKDSILKYIDMLARYKMNVFHWHLTDDQGWRIEIKKYPLLTQIGSKRKETIVDKNFNPYLGDHQPYEGYYTQEEIKEVVAYAKNRNVTIVPEIEMPGHALAALAAYPQFSCTGGPFDVLTKWGVSEDVFCPKEATFVFIKDVLTEVMNLFPGTFIHIGGDEVPKTRWKSCANCQQLIKDKHLKDEHELQSYFITRIDSFLTANGRNTIGWDEILEGGLAPHAAVMSWRGTEGGIAAARQKHQVVMCPGSHCYFDHYQGNRKTEPLAIGGYTTVQKVYLYEPTPDSLKDSEKEYVLGAQGNVWTEYIPDFKQVSYMAMPRLAALSEVLWTPKVARKYSLFQDRLVRQLPELSKMGITYSKALYDINSELTAAKNHKGVELTLTAPFANGEIYYTLNDSEPTLQSLKYVSSLIISNKQTIKAAYFDKGKKVGNTWSQSFYPSLSTGKKVALSNPPSSSYNQGGSLTLVDGIVGQRPWYGKEWLGWSGKDCNVTIDLDSVQALSAVFVSTLKDEASWIYLPSAITVLVSDDNIKYTQVMRFEAKEIEQFNGTVPIYMSGFFGRYVQIKIQNKGIIAEGKPGAGEPAWLFVDELIVQGPELVAPHQKHDGHKH
jgi:hexosaminidase